MSLSRYRNTNFLNNKQYYETVSFPDKETLDAIPSIQVRISKFDRLDNLAFKFLGSNDYWWVIALVNNIDWAFKFEEGQLIKIPVDVQDVLKLF